MDGLASRSEPLFTPRFFVMCGFTFTVFLSAFQLLPTAPFHIRALGGSSFASGLFLGLLTYCSALSAPFTGSVADRIGRPRTLFGASLILTGFAVVYGFVTDYRVLLALVPLQGIVWSSLLSASAAHMTSSVIPASRRAEGVAYWGMSSMMAVALAPAIGFAVFRHGWGWLCASAAVANLVMAAIAWSLRHDAPRPVAVDVAPAGLLEWRILGISAPLFLYGFGHGGVTSFSAVLADARGITPKAIYLTTLAVVMLATRPLVARLNVRFGPRRVFMTCLALMPIGLALLAPASNVPTMVASALVFGAGIGMSYPVFVAYVIHDVAEHRRGAAFGAILAAFDTGIGTGSTVMGWLIGRWGFTSAFGVAAGLAALALPLFLVADRRFGPTRQSPVNRPSSIVNRQS